MGYRPEIDGLRAVAVLLVLFFHAGFPEFSGGFIGVDIFFVISGFLINRLILTELATTGTFSFRNFYLRRARRLGPALMVTCAGSFVAGAFLFAPQDFGRLAGSTIAALTSTSNVYLWLQTGYFDALSSVKPLLHTWSLSVEEQFYLIWPALLVLGYRSSRRPDRTIPVIIVLSFAVSLAANLWMQAGIDHAPLLAEHLADGPSTIFYLMPFRIFELATGALLFWIIDRKIPTIIRDGLLIAGAILIIFAVRHFDSHTIFPSLNGLIPCIGAALIMVGAPGHLGILLRNRFAVGIGLISYSLYLVHWPLIVFYGYYRDRPLAASNMRSLIVISIVLAIAMYFWVEQPLRKPFPVRARHFVPGLATAAAALIAIAWPAQSGWSWRLPAASAMIVSAESEYGGADCSPICGHGTQGPTVFVIGDSFSRQLYAGLTASFPLQRFKFFDEGTCTTFSPNWSRWEDTQTQVRDCRRARILSEGFLKNRDAKVIFAYNWVRQYYFDLDDPEEHKSFAKIGDLGPFIFSEIGRLKEYLKLDSVLVIANPPTLGIERTLAQCLGRPLARADVDACQFTPEKSVEERRYLATFPDRRGISVLDPFDAFCDGSICKTYDDKGLFYSDAYHLSRRGSEVLVDHFKDEIEGWMSWSSGPGTASLGDH